MIIKYVASNGPYYVRNGYFTFAVQKYDDFTTWEYVLNNKSTGAWPTKVEANYVDVYEDSNGNSTALLGDRYDRVRLFDGTIHSFEYRSESLTNFTMIPTNTAPILSSEPDPIYGNYVSLGNGTFYNVNSKFTMNYKNVDYTLLAGGRAGNPGTASASSAASWGPASELFDGLANGNASAWFAAGSLGGRQSVFKSTRSIL